MYCQNDLHKAWSPDTNNVTYITHNIMYCQNDSHEVWSPDTNNVTYITHNIMYCQNDSHKAWPPDTTMLHHTTQTQDSHIAKVHQKGYSIKLKGL